MFSFLYMCLSRACACVRVLGRKGIYIVVWFILITNRGLYLESLDRGIRGFINLQLFYNKLERQAAEPSPDSQGGTETSGRAGILAPEGLS